MALFLDSLAASNRDPLSQRSALIGSGRPQTDVQRAESQAKRKRKGRDVLNKQALADEKSKTNKLPANGRSRLFT